MSTPAGRYAKDRLGRALGVGFGVAVAVGGTIGAGILRTPADVAARLPVPALFLGAWVLGGLYALLGANALAELGTALPRSGGQYVFVRQALGPYAGFLVGWNDWISTCGSVAAIALVFGAAVGALVPALAGNAASVALVAVALITVVLWRGVRESDRAQRVTSVLKAAALLALVIACVSARLLGRVVPEVPGAEHGVAALPMAAGLPLAAALVVALQGIIYTYDGWTGVLYFSEEVRDAGREIPRSLFGGVISVMALYLLINVAFLAVLSLPAIASSSLTAASAATAVFGPRGGALVQSLVVVALPSAIVANILMASRVVFGLGRDGAAPAFLTRVNVGGTPGRALVASAAVAGLFLLTGTFERVITVCAFMFVGSYALSFASLFVLRRREPDLPRPYRAWGHPYTTGAVLAGSLAFLAGSVAADRDTGLAALALVALSYPVFRATERKVAEE
jgi:APA family basic amino acid/polyamine antiporter